MTKALNHQPKAAIADLGVEYTPDYVALRGPDVEQAFVVFARDRVFRVGEVEDTGAIFEDHGMTGSAQEIFEQMAERFWSHGEIFSGLWGAVCDR